MPFVLIIWIEPNERYKQNAKLIRDLFNAEGALESPIDLDISYMKIIELDPLEWIGIDVAPRKLKITNTGFTGNTLLEIIIYMCCMY